MKIRPVINVRGDKLSRGFLAAVEFCHEISGAEIDAVDLSMARFVSPAFLLPSIVHMEGLGVKPAMENESSYLRTVHFTDGGVDAAAMDGDKFRTFMEGLSGCTYIPVVKFPTGPLGTAKRDSILASVFAILHDQGRFEDNIGSGLRYIIGETTDNIVEHAHSPFGYIAAQSYPTKGYTDICIADTGGTILGSYAENPRTAGIGSDVEAIQSAIAGISAKNLPEAENRGFGLRTTIRMLTGGLDGEYLLASGNAAFAANRNAQQYIELPLGVRFGGTIIAFRIPNNIPTFRISDYYE